MQKIGYFSGFGFFLVFTVLFLVAGCSREEMLSGSTESVGTQVKNSRNTWMTMNIPWSGVLAKPFSWGEEVKESDKPEIKLDSKSEFIIYVTLGSSRYMIYNVVAIRSDGMVIAAYKDRGSYKYYQKKFRLSAGDIQKLRQILIKQHAGAMPASVISSDNSTQGVQGGFTLKSAGKIRRSYFNNAWPGSFKNIVDYINTNILRYNPAAFDNGFMPVQKSILTVDPEATMAIRGLLNGK